ncbi:MAG TPA: MMPL family transporter, partial [Puia sp.]
MWESLARLVLKFRLPLLLLLLAATAFMAYHASNVKLSYDFNSSIPTDNPKYIANLHFRQEFGDDGNLLVVGVQTDSLFKKDIFNGYIDLGSALKKISGVDDVLSIPMAIDLVKDSVTEKPRAVSIFPRHPHSQAAIDSGKAVFERLPFYNGLLYNAETQTWLMAVRVNKDVMNSARRIVTVSAIIKEVRAFGTRYGLDMHLSGLPLIRTVMAQKVSRETTWFLLGSVVLSAIILMVFFRSVGTMLLSLGVVIIGVVFSLGTMDLLGYKITLLNALTPTLMVVIGIPNCIYFLNKYHTAFRDTGDQREALLLMIG